jgi:hypothetical protein
MFWMFAQLLWCGQFGKQGMTYVFRDQGGWEWRSYSAGGLTSNWKLLNKLATRVPGRSRRW